MCTTLSTSPSVSIHRLLKWCSRKSILLPMENIIFINYNDLYLQKNPLSVNLCTLSFGILIFPDRSCKMNSSNNRLLSDSNTAAILHMIANVYKRDNIFTGISNTIYYILFILLLLLVLLFINIRICIIVSRDVNLALQGTCLRVHRVYHMFDEYNGVPINSSWVKA